MDIRGRTFLVLRHPAFLALLLTLMALPFLPEWFEEYKVERIEAEKLSFRKGARWALSKADLNGSGELETVRLEKRDRGYVYVLKDADGGVLRQLNPPPADDFLGISNGTPPFIADLEDRGKKRLFFLVQRKDSIFLERVSPFEDSIEDVFDRTFVDTILHDGPKGYNANSEFLEPQDLNGDGTKELIFNVFTYFSVQPRNLYVWDPKTNSITRSPTSGAFLNDATAHDIEGNGKPEFLINTKAQGNLPKDFPFTDQSAWLMAFDRNLDFLFEPVEFPSFKSSIRTAPFHVGDSSYIAALYHYGGKKEKPQRLMLYNSDGERLEEKAFFLEDKTFNSINIFTLPSDRERLFIMNYEGRIAELDQNLDTVGEFRIQRGKNKIDLRDGCINNTLDIDGDDRKELIFISEDNQRAWILRQDLSDPVTIEMPFEKNLKKLASKGSFQLKRKEGEDPILAIQAGEMWYEWEYWANPWSDLRYAIYGGIWGALAILIFGIQKLATYKLERDKEKLEEEIQKATYEISEHRDQLEAMNREMNDSIQYASFIQNAVLPDRGQLRDVLGDHFILLKPQSEVSGDFYWCYSDGTHDIWAAADCTGHGVPGAFMSMIGISLLDETVVKQGERDPARILDKVRKGVVQKLGGGKQKDGMDIALCMRTENEQGERILRFAGANNPLYIVREEAAESLESLRERNGAELSERIRPIKKEFRHGIEIKGDKQAIGFEEEDPPPFSSIELPLQKGDLIYSFSDGYADQFGGPKGKKFRYASFKELLVELRGEDMAEQKRILEERFEEWKGEQEQIDDVLVIGVRI